MIETPTANYTSADWVQLFQDVGANSSAAALDYIIANNMTTFQPPGVTTYCVYGIDLPTPYYAYFNVSDFNTTPQTKTSSTSFISTPLILNSVPYSFSCC